MMTRSLSLKTGFTLTESMNIFQNQDRLPNFFYKDCDEQDYERFYLYLYFYAILRFLPKFLTDVFDSKPTLKCLRTKCREEWGWLNHFRLRRD